MIEESDQEAVSQIIGFLSHPGPPSSGGGACRALLLAGAKDKTAVLINAVADEQDELVRKAALVTLARLRGKGADDFLCQFYGRIRIPSIGADGRSGFGIFGQSGS